MSEIFIRMPKGKIGGNAYTVTREEWGGGYTGSGRVTREEAVGLIAITLAEMAGWDRYDLTAAQAERLAFAAEKVSAFVRGEFSE